MKHFLGLLFLSFGTCIFDESDLRAFSFDPRGTSDGEGGGHLSFPAAPDCGFKSSKRAFFDSERRLCVILDNTDLVAPLSAPCPPGSGRRPEEFLCRGEIDTAYEIQCKHSANVIPTRPFYANMDYQCIQALSYTQRPKRCPNGFKLKKLVDRYGTRLGRRGTLCVAYTSRVAEIVDTHTLTHPDTLTLGSCLLTPATLPTFSSLLEAETYTLDPDVELDLDLNSKEDLEGASGEGAPGEGVRGTWRGGVPEGENSSSPNFVQAARGRNQGNGARGRGRGTVSKGSVSGGGKRRDNLPQLSSECAHITAHKIVRCPPLAQLVYNDPKAASQPLPETGNPVTGVTGSSGGSSEGSVENEWLCVSKTYTTPEFDPTGCVKGWHWSHEFLACVKIHGYLPPKKCPSGTNRKPYRHSGVTRRHFKSPRYNGWGHMLNDDPSSANDTTVADDLVGDGYGAAETYRCLADSALPDFPFCPSGYWLEAYKGYPAPVCIREETFDPLWNCDSVLNARGPEHNPGQTATSSGKTSYQIPGKTPPGFDPEQAPAFEREIPSCTVEWDDASFAIGPNFLSKRQKWDAKNILKKPVLSGLDLDEGAADAFDISRMSSFVQSADTAWHQSLQAALQLLDDNQ